MCPIRDRPVDPEYTVIYEDGMIAFCCGDCLARFEADPASVSVQE